MTICTQGRALFFADEAMRAIAERRWVAIPEHSSTVVLDEWVIMPNHVHGLIFLGGRGGMGGPGILANAPTRAWEVADHASPFGRLSPQRNSVAAIGRTYKAAVTTACRQAGYHGFAWQRGYYDRIVRNDHELATIQNYIYLNPERWDQDEHHPGKAAHKKPPTST